MIVVALLASAILLAIGGLWARVSRRRWQGYRVHRDRFFELAKELMKDEDCPIELAFALRQLGATMNDRAVLYLLLFSAATHGRFLPSPNRLWDALQKIPSSVRGRFIAASHEACLAVSYRSAILGVLIRRSLFRRNHNREREQAAVRRLVYYGQKHRTPEYAKPLAERLCRA